MARHARFEPVNAGKMGWRLNIPASYAETGKREQRFFRTRQQALDHARNLRTRRDEFGRQAKSITPTLAESAVRAEEILRPFGITVLEAAERIAEMERRARESRTVAEAVSAFMETKETRSAARQREIRYLSETMIEAFGDRLLSNVTGREIAEMMASRYRSASMFNRRIADAAMFIRWAARKPRQWADAAEIEHFERKDHRKGDITVMTARQAKDLLRAAEEHHPDTVPAFVLMMMMGIRPLEITKMTADHITEDGVTVPLEDETTGEGTKTGRRFIHMTPNVAEWLRVYPVEGTVAPPNWGRKWDAVRRIAGWGVAAGMLKGRKWSVTPDLPAWSQDILRHTAATIAINTGKPLSVLIFEHGHSQGETTIKKHYLGRMTRKEALAILRIGPNGTQLKTITAA